MNALAPGLPTPTPTPGYPANSYIRGLSVDAQGNSYAAGRIQGTASIDFDTNHALTGVENNVIFVLVKYDAAQSVQWIVHGNGNLSSEYNAVASNSSGVYVAGTIYGAGTTDFGNGVSVVTDGNGLGHAILVKYNSAGLAQWAKAAQADKVDSRYNSIALDNSGNVYLGGQAKGRPSFGSAPASTLDFGDGVLITAASKTSNLLIVKYNATGTAQWARTQTDDGEKPNKTFTISSVSADGSGVYAAGSIDATASIDFGNGKTLSLGTSVGSFYGNGVLIKYDQDGLAEWVTAVSSTGANSSDYESVVVTPSGVYAAGGFYGNGTVNLGNGISATPNTSTANIVSVLLVKYDNTGTPQWAKTQTGGSANGINEFSSLAEYNGNIYAAGYGSASSTLDFGNGVTGQTGPAQSAVLVRYDTTGLAQSARVVSTQLQSGSSVYDSIAIDSHTSTVQIFAAGFTGTGLIALTGGSVIASGSQGSGFNAIFALYQETP